MYCISINYKKAPLEVRSRFAFSPEEQRQFLRKKHADDMIAGCVLLSTCNRVEYYVNFKEERCADFSDNCYVNQSKKRETGDLWERMERDICEERNLDIGLCRKYINCYHGDRALKHLHRVAAGVDSMVLGEDEILGQVKAAFLLAMEEGCTDYQLNTIFKSAVTGAKRIKTDTELSRTSVSVATLAAGRILAFEKQLRQESGWENRPFRVMIIGITGKTGSTVMKNICNRENLFVIGTSRQHGSDGTVTQMDGAQMVLYRERYDVMGQCDVVVSATGSPHYTVTKAEWQQAVKNCGRKGRTLFLDLSVPADIDSGVEGDQTTLYQIDYFTELARSNNEKKLIEKERAELMVEEQLDEVKKDLLFHEIVPEIPKLKDQAEKYRFEQILYRVRQQADYPEMQGFFRALKKALEET